MTQLFLDTKQMVASYYMTSYMPTRVYEDRQEFIANELADLFFVDHIFMVYVGEGFCPLSFAVIADNESDAVEAVEEYLRNNGRADEIGEDGDHISAVQEVPADFIRKIAPPPPPPTERTRHFPKIAGRLVRVRAIHDYYRLTGDVRREIGARCCEYEVTLDTKAHAWFVPWYNLTLV